MRPWNTSSLILRPRTAKRDRIRWVDAGDAELGRTALATSFVWKRESGINQSRFGPMSTKWSTSRPHAQISFNVITLSSPCRTGCRALALHCFAARWEKRYNTQVSATEEALLAKRNAEISLREVERVLAQVRAEADKAAHEAAIALAEAVESSTTERVEGRNGEERTTDMARQ